jgi:hypothetical protein
MCFNVFVYCVFFSYTVFQSLVYFTVHSNKSFNLDNFRNLLNFNGIHGEKKTETGKFYKNYTKKNSNTHCNGSSNAAEFAGINLMHSRLWKFASIQLLACLCKRNKMPLINKQIENNLF